VRLRWVEQSERGAADNQGLLWESNCHAEWTVIGMLRSPNFAWAGAPR